MTKNNYPDNWVIIHLKGNDEHYRVLAGWSGGYLSSDSWQLNSGIVGVRENNDILTFVGSSGSEYHCHKEAYGLRMNNAYIWDKLKQTHDDLVELMDESTDWLTVDWIIKPK